MPGAPGFDIDGGEVRLRPETGSAHGGVGDGAAVVLFRVQKSDRGTREIQIMHGVAVRQFGFGERADQTVAAARNVVQVDQLDSKPGAQPRQKFAPSLMDESLKIVASNFSLSVLLELPFIADRDQQVVVKCRGRRRNQRPHVVFRPAAVAVDHVQQSGQRIGQSPIVRQRELAQRTERVGGDVGADEVKIIRMVFEKYGHVAPREITALGAERAAAQMDNERIVAENVAKSGASGAHAKVVFLTVAETEDRIEGSDRVDECPSDIETESDTGRQFRIGRHCSQLERADHRLGVALRRPRIVLAKARQRADFGVVGKRRNGADARVRLRAAHELVEPAAGDDRIGVEQNHVGACARRAHAAIGGQCEADIVLIRDTIDLRQPARSYFFKVGADRRVGRCVVDEQQAVIAVCAQKNAVDAALQIVDGIVDRDDDVDCGAGWVRHQRARASQSFTRNHGSLTHQRALCR